MIPVQYFTDEYLERCKKMTPEQIVRFLDDFRLLYSTQSLKKINLSKRYTPEELIRALRKNLG